LARVLQNVLWDVEHNDPIWHTEPDRAIALTLLDSLGVAPRPKVLIRDARDRALRPKTLGSSAQIYRSRCSRS